jgi:hypothetical protein
VMAGWKSFIGRVPKADIGMRCKRRPYCLLSKERMDETGDRL